MIKDRFNFRLLTLFRSAKLSYCGTGITGIQLPRFSHPTRVLRSARNCSSLKEMNEMRPTLFSSLKGRRGWPPPPPPPLGFSSIVTASSLDAFFLNCQKTNSEKYFRRSCFERCKNGRRRLRGSFYSSETAKLVVKDQIRSGLRPLASATAPEQLKTIFHRWRRRCPSA